MTLLSGTSEADVDAPVDRCWAVVQDVGRWPDWQQGIVSVEVVERDDDGRPLVCDTVLDAKIKKIRARVRISYDPPGRLEFTRVQSDDFDEMRGSWELRETGAGRTHAVYTLAVDPGHVGLMARPLEKALRPIVVGRRADELARAVTARG
jgi:hypothetical protein